MSLLSNMNVVVAFILLLFSVSIADNEKNKSLCDICECSTSEVKCNSVVDPDLLLTYDGSDVERINITSSELGYLRKEHFSKFQNITSVLLNSNKLIIDSSSLSLLTEIATINLDNNAIELFATGIFENNVKLLNLSLDGNKIKYIENNAFKNLHNLTRLFLANNSIENLATGAFVGLSSLEELHLGGNQLQRVSAHIFSPLERLRLLSLRDNLLEEVEEGAWSGLEATLEELDLSGNRLLRADAALAPLRALRVLRLERNRIASFGPALVEALAQRPGLSAQLQPNPLRCACGELRDAWAAASARGLRMTLFCADGRPWDVALRNLSCKDTNSNTTGISNEAKNKPAGILTESTIREYSSSLADTSPDNSSGEVETVKNRSTNSPTVSEEIETSVEITPIMNETTLNDTSANTRGNSKSAAAESSHESDVGESDSSVESEITLIPVEREEENFDIDGTLIQDSSRDDIESPDDGAETKLNPAQLVALAEGIVMADAIWEVVNGVQTQPSEKSEVNNGDLSPAQLVALAEGVEMVEAVAQAAKEVEPSDNAMWKATLEAESSFRQNNAPQFEESLDTSLITSLACVLIVLSVSGSAVAIVLYHKLKNSPEEDNIPPNMYVRVSNSEPRRTSACGTRNVSDIRDVSYSFPDLEEVALS